MIDTVSWLTEQQGFLGGLMHWRHFLHVDTFSFTEALTISPKNRKWKDLLESNGVDVLGLPKTIKAFVETWENDDFKIFIEGNGIKNIWDLERKSRTVFEAFVVRDADGKISALVPNLRNRKRWARKVFSKEWIDTYLAENPSIITLKSTPQGLRKHLREQGLYDYFRDKIELNRLNLCEMPVRLKIVATPVLSIYTFYRCPLTFNGKAHVNFSIFKSISALMTQMSSTSEQGEVSYNKSEINLCRCAQEFKFVEIVRFFTSPFSVESCALDRNRIKRIFMQFGILSYSQLDQFFPDVSRCLILRGLYRNVGLKYNIDTKEDVSLEDWT